MVEARYRGQKVVVVSPDYAEHTKFADHWLAAEPGSDGALAMAMGHVILKEFYVDRQVPYFQDYARRFTDLPLLVTLRERDGALRARPAAARVRPRGAAARRARRLEDGGARRAHRRAGGARTARSATATASDEGRWNLRLDGIEPALTLLDRAQRARGGRPAALRRRRERGRRRSCVAACRRCAIGGQLVTTVLDLVLAQYGVGRDGLPGEWPDRL